MKTTKKSIITVQTIINAPVEKVWNLWTDPIHIVRWNNASEDWFTPGAENDLRAGGSFLSRMEAKDGSSGFDFKGNYSKVVQDEQIEYTMDDGRKVQVLFASGENTTTVTENFEAEQHHANEIQKTGWQAILDNFKKYVESSAKRITLHFEILIDRATETVYQTMLDKKTYPVWTGVFNPSFRFIGSWEKGSQILFLGTDEDGSTQGMVSRIKENVPNRFVSIEHKGIVQDSKEILYGPKADQWAGALENYTFNEDNGSTLLKVDLDSDEEYKSYFEDTYPKALNKLKEICENLSFKKSA